ncbi:MAG TPA: zinc-dependent metalloprotease [Solirubrobacteraceae bacterium]|nr:zinc-dependent metalloprotease [Solirubrobacteraceae bacterium]
MDGIDWNVAQRVGEMLAGGSPYLGSSANGVQSLAEEFAERVSAYTGLALGERLPVIESIDRPRWIEANIATMRPLLEPLSERLGHGSGPFAPAMRSITQLLLGAQVGAVTGMLSQRVLGQYDIALLDPARPPRLLLLAPNLAQAARNLGLDREQLTAWVAIHEVTHAVQFGGTPWLRGHLAGLLRELIDGMQVNVGLGRSLRIPDAADLRALARRLRSGELLRLGLGEDRWALVDRMQATMSLIEGHAEHVMDAVGADVLPTLNRMRAAMTRRRRERGWPWRILERLLGLEMKLRQYEVGRGFCDEVVAQAGPAALTVAWSSAAMLPSTSELQSPGLWLARTHVPPVTN